MTPPRSGRTTRHRSGRSAERRRGRPPVTLPFPSAPRASRTCRGGCRRSGPGETPWNRASMRGWERQGVTASSRRATSRAISRRGAARPSPTWPEAPTRRVAAPARGAPCPGVPPRLHARARPDRTRRARAPCALHARALRPARCAWREACAAERLRCNTNTCCCAVGAEAHGRRAMKPEPEGTPTAPSRSASEGPAPRRREASRGARAQRPSMRPPSRREGLSSCRPLARRPGITPGRLVRRPRALRRPSAPGARAHFPF